MSLSTDLNVNDIFDACASGNHAFIQELLNNLTENEETSESDDYFRDFLSSAINSRDCMNCTPIHISIIHKHIELLPYLIAAGGSYKRKCEGSSIFHLALSTHWYTGSDRDAEVMIRQIFETIGPEANLNDSDDTRNTIMHLTAWYDFPLSAATVISLYSTQQLESNSKSRPLHKLLKSRNYFGDQPFHLAARHNSLLWISSMIKICKDYDDNILLKLLSSENNKCETPLQIAQRFCNHQARNLLSRSIGGSSSSGLYPSTQNVQCKTLLLTHETSFMHLTASTLSNLPPENVLRLHVLTPNLFPPTIDSYWTRLPGILTTRDFKDKVAWLTEFNKAVISDVLRVHDYSYVSKIAKYCHQLTDLNEIGHLDGDTAISGKSFEAALFAAGSVVTAVDCVMSGQYKNAFCAVRPPGHHAGTRGIVNELKIFESKKKKSDDDDDDEGSDFEDEDNESTESSSRSHGFCLFNNVAIGAAYAMNVYRSKIHKVAIVDFDVHHGNGTQELIQRLVPSVSDKDYETPVGNFCLSHVEYKPWFDDDDCKNVMFMSVHGYSGNQSESTPGSKFYPGTGKTHECKLNDDDKGDGLLIVNIGMDKQTVKKSCLSIQDNAALDDDEESLNQEIFRHEWRKEFRHVIFPKLLEFKPDFIFCSSGFDGHNKDDINCGYLRLVEEDYEWVTSSLVSIAHDVCGDRIVSVLEGGYRIQGFVVSPFAKSVASHVRGLCQTRDACDAGYSVDAMEIEEKLEFDYIESIKIHMLEQAEEIAHEAAQETAECVYQVEEGAEVIEEIAEAVTEAVDTAGASRKRRRCAVNVDYVALEEKLRQEANH